MAGYGSFLLCGVVHLPSLLLDAVTPKVLPVRFKRVWRIYLFFHHAAFLSLYGLSAKCSFVSSTLTLKDIKNNTPKGVVLIF